MASPKTRRRHRIGELLITKQVRSQAELVALLAEEGLVATQATVSRDLDELGAIKVRGPNGTSSYAMPELPFTQRGGDDHLQRILSEWVVSIDASANLTVVRTPPGSAHVVGSALDRAGLDGVLGNVCGDDTVIIVSADPTGGAAVGDRLAELAGHRAGSHQDTDRRSVHMTKNHRS